MSIPRSIHGNHFSGRRKLLVLALVALSIIVVRLIWGTFSERRVRESLAALRAQGEPAEPSDIVHPHVPEEQNAWAVQLEAINAQDASVESPHNSNMAYIGYPPYRPRWWKMAEASEQANASAFAFLRQSRQLSRVQLRTTLATPLFSNFLLPRANGAKALANSLADAAEYAHLKGDDAESLDRIFDLMHLNRSLRHDDFLVSQLIGIGVDTLTFRAIQTIAPGLRIGAAAPVATPQQVRQLIDALLDERLPREGMERCIVMERLIWIEFCRTQATGTWFTKPLADRAIVHALSNFELYRQAVLSNDMPTAQALLDQCQWTRRTPSTANFGGATARVIPRYSRWYTGFDPVIAPSIHHYFRALAERRLTAAALACHLFRADHGRWPERLEEIAPAYLPAIPADPFHSDGRRIGYLIVKGVLPDGRDRPLLYFDHAALDHGPPVEPAYSQHTHMPGTRHRQYRDLARWNPPGQSAAEAVDDNPEETDAPGEEEKADEEPQ